MVMNAHDLHASFIMISCLSATRASTSTSGWPASTLPVNVPATPGIMAEMRQNPAVTAHAIPPALRKSLREYFSFITLSRT